MRLQPDNRHILVRPIEEETEEELAIVLPTGYEKPQSPYALCEVLANAMDCKLHPHIGEHIIVERRMLHKIEVNGETFYLVLENYVFGRIKNEANQRNIDPIGTGGNELPF